MERFDLSDPTFDVTSERVHAAREESWYVETNWGWAVLRYAEVSALLRDRRFRQGNARWPAQNGIHSGLFSRLVAGDAAQPRGRRPRPDPAAADAGLPQQGDRRDAAALPGARERADRRVRVARDGSSSSPSSPSRTPPGSSASCSGCRRTHWPAGGALGRRPRRVVLASTSATRCRRSRRRSTGLARLRRRGRRRPRAHPQDDLVTTLVQAVDDERRPADRHELGVALVFLAFAGMETTRNQLGLALQTLLAAPGPVAAPGRASRARRPRRRGGDAGQPDGHLGDPRGARGRRLPGPAHPARRHRADDVARGRHRPAAMPDPSFDITAAAAAAPRLRRRVSTTAWATSSPARTWRSPCPCWRNGCRTRWPTDPVAGSRSRATRVRWRSRSGSHRATDRSMGVGRGNPRGRSRVAPA